MKGRLSEETVLFFSVVKWVRLATGIGALVGLSSAGFLWVLDWATTWSASMPRAYVSLPLALWFSALLATRLAPTAGGHGTEHVIAAIHQGSGKIPVTIIPVKLTATVVTIAAGGSAGRAGPCAQIGGGAASLFAAVFRFDEFDQRKLTICGISGGFSAVFGAPIAGAIFGVEVLSAGSLRYDVLLPSFISGVIAHQVASRVSVPSFHHPVEFVPSFSEWFFLEVALAGVFFGLCAWLLIEGMRLGARLAASWNVAWPWKAILAGLVLVGLTLLVGERYLGLGLDTIRGTLDGGTVPWYAFLLKAVFTIVTLSFGGSGGIITPIFFMGASAGSGYATFLGVDPATFAAIGIVSVLAGAANTPVAASIMAAELFGLEVASYAAVACVISFVMSGHRSVFPSQVLALRKSRLIDVELGGAIEQIKPRLETMGDELPRVLARLRRLLRS